MNNEQNRPDQASKAEQDTNKGFEGNKADDYYSVDDPKKEISTTIGDGEMHNEGLVGEGNVPEANPLSQERLQDEQDAAELHDSQG